MAKKHSARSVVIFFVGKPLSIHSAGPAHLQHSRTRQDLGVYVCMSKHICIRMYICICIYNVHVVVHGCRDMYLYLYIYIYIYTHTSVFMCILSLCLRILCQSFSVR